MSPIDINTNTAYSKSTTTATATVTNNTNTTSSSSGDSLQGKLEWNVVAATYLDITEISLFMISSRILTSCNHYNNNNNNSSSKKNTKAKTATTSSSTNTAATATSADSIETEKIIITVEPTINELLQLLGILAEIENKGLLAYVGEPIWRGIFLVCSMIESGHSGVFCRHVAWVLYDTMKSFNIPMNTLTYGGMYVC